jgi:hypothetical protein
VRTVDLAADALKPTERPGHGDPPIQREAPFRGLLVVFATSTVSGGQGSQLVEVGGVHPDAGAHYYGRDPRGVVGPYSGFGILPGSDLRTVGKKDRLDF